MTTTRQIAKKMTAKVFSGPREGNVEAHLSPSQLEALFLICAELTVQLRPDPMAVEAVAREPIVTPNHVHHGRVYAGVSPPEVVEEARRTGACVYTKAGYEGERCPICHEPSHEHMCL